MALHRLATLDRRTIAVELSQNGLTKTLHGKAAYGQDPELGGVLTINVRESWGDFDFVLREDEFDGEISPSSLPDCDYRIALSTGSMCSR